MQVARRGGRHDIQPPARQGRFEGAQERRGRFRGGAGNRRDGDFQPDRIALVRAFGANPSGDLVRQLFQKHGQRLRPAGLDLLLETPGQPAVPVAEFPDEAGRSESVRHCGKFDAPRHPIAESVTCPPAGRQSASMQRSLEVPAQPVLEFRRRPFDSPDLDADAVGERQKGACLVALHDLRQGLAGGHQQRRREKAGRPRQGCSPRGGRAGKARGRSPDAASPQRPRSQERSPRRDGAGLQFSGTATSDRPVSAICRARRCRTVRHRRGRNSCRGCGP